MALILGTSSIWVTIAPVLVINAFAITFLMIFTFTRKRPETPDYLKGRHNSKILSGFLKEWWYWFTDPIAKFFIKIRLSPNMITFIGFLISAISAVFFAVGLFGYAGWIMVSGATFDMFDGRVARFTGKSTRSGAYFDSVMDRFGEGAILLGVAYYYRTSWLLIPIIVALIGSTLVSYTRARGEGVGVVCKKGAMQRPERVVYLGVGAILQPVADSILSIWWSSPPAVLVIGAILITAVMTIVTSVQRMIYIMNELDTMDRDDEKASLPQILTAFSTKKGRDKWRDQAKYGYDRTCAKKKHTLLILIDGANYKVFDELLKKGDLPNISRYVVEPGCFKRATSTFPSTTGPAFTPFITGCFAGTSDIPGIRWFDRTVPPGKKLTLKRFRDYYGWGSYALDSDLSKNVKTIFEYSRRAINIMGMLNRGTGVSRDPAFFKIPFLFKKKDDAEFVERQAFRMFVNALKRLPDFIFYYFPTVDKCSVDNAYRRVDSYVGQMVELLKEHGMFETTSIIITSDHGHSDVSEHFDLDAFFEKRFKTLYVPLKFREWANAEVINMVSGNSMSNVYLRKGDWSNYTTYEDVEENGIMAELFENDAVDIVAGRARNGGVLVSSKRGFAKLDGNSDGKISYSVVGSDPFGYNNIPEQMTFEEALVNTWNSNYPDAIVQLLQIFRSKRCGDLVVSAAEGFDLRGRFETPEHSSTHGALYAQHMNVPLCISEKVDEDYIRTVDIFPTMLSNLGMKMTGKIDGRSLI